MRVPDMQFFLSRGLGVVVPKALAEPQKARLDVMEQLFEVNLPNISLSAAVNGSLPLYEAGDEPGPA